MSIKQRLDRLERRIPPPSTEPSIFGDRLDSCTVDELTAMIEHVDRVGDRPGYDPLRDPFMLNILERAQQRAGGDHEHETQT